MTQAAKAKPYEPISFKRMHLNPESCRVYARQDRHKNLMIEISCNELPVMIFVYHHQTDWMLRQRMQQFSKLMDNAELSDPIRVQELPRLFCRMTTSELGESMFWSDPNSLVSVPPEKDGAATIEIRSPQGPVVASFTVAGCVADDDAVIMAAVRLKEKLQTRSKVRIESLWEDEKIVWYV